MRLSTYVDASNLSFRQLAKMIGVNHVTLYCQYIADKSDAKKYEVELSQSGEIVKITHVIYEDKNHAN